MARQEVVQVRCDRCKRVELMPPSTDDKQPDFEARLGTQLLVYEDLCDRCKDTLSNLWTEMGEWDRQLTQHFGPTVGKEQAPPLEPSPNFKPPKPHSPAGTERS